jgi:signal transduction histidine kinase
MKYTDLATIMTSYALSWLALTRNPQGSSLMGSRGRSIQLRMYFLVAIPLITMLGLFGYVAYTSVNNFLNLDRAPSLIRTTSIPITNFVSLLQAERRAAIVYESQPSAANLAAYQSTITASKKGLTAFEGVVNSSTTKGDATAGETAALAKMVSDVTGMSGLRAEVSANKISPINTLLAYSEIIADQDNVFQAQAASMTDTVASSQGLGLISTINAREDISEQDAVLAGALAANSLTGPERAAFGQAAGRQFEDTQLYQKLLSPAELTDFNATLNKLAPASIQSDLTKVQDAVEADVPLATMEQQGLTPANWLTLTSMWQKANYQAGSDAATATLGSDEQLAANAKTRVWETAGVGLVGLILTLIVSLLLTRSVNRRLATLRRSALTLAHEQLPSVVARLRRGESVDVAAEAPPLQVGGDEIGQVGRAIDTVRQTAIRSAIDEARIRQGVNDMFRNLARRNQSLLQRQLSVLDEMERRATDPDVLEDLFKMDHLTTRMRRHAEGLIILSGAPPGRSWSAPVKLVDVMRGAVAEVEDYARVTVSTQSHAALAGSAVTDVIHLLAELIENATTLSPPFTQVRVSGEIVASGFAIEIEDRGLGMVPQRLQELNERLANPPDINPANTEQLGLFVVGQLARRHGIRVMLRPSSYGGTSAVALVPSVLIVEEGPAAITSGTRAPAAAGAPDNGASYSNGPSSPSYSNGPSHDAGGYAYGSGARTGARTGPMRMGDPGGASGSGTASRPAASRNGPATPGPGYPPPGAPDPRLRDPRERDPRAPDPRERDRAARSGDFGAGNQDHGRSMIRISGAPQYPRAADSYSTPGAAPTAPQTAVPGMPSGPVDGARRGGRHGAEDVPVVTGVPVGKQAQTQIPPFDVFTPIQRQHQGPQAPDAAYPPPDHGSGGWAPGTSYASPYAEPTSGSYQGDGMAYGAAGPYGSNSPDFGQNGDSGAGHEGAAPSSAEDSNGLPRRVRQASLAPELRASTAAGSTGVPQANAASLAVMRSTLSAMQRGWQQGRSQAQQDTEGEANGN